ncbi:hypothetical protein Bca4012_103789 [Brassica carinata]
MPGGRSQRNSGGGHGDTGVQIVRLTWVGRGGCFVEPSHGIEAPSGPFLSILRVGNPSDKRLSRTKGSVKIRNRGVAPAHPGSGSAEVSKVNSLWSMEQCRQGSRQNGSVTGKRIGSEGWARRSQFEPVDCWRTARAASGEAARRVSAGADWEQLSGVSWASNSQLRTECGQGNPTV